MDILLLWYIELVDHKFPDEYERLEECFLYLSVVSTQIFPTWALAIAWEDVSSASVVLESQMKYLFAEWSFRSAKNLLQMQGPSKIRGPSWPL